MTCLGPWCFLAECNVDVEQIFSCYDKEVTVRKKVSIGEAEEKE